MSNQTFPVIYRNERYMVDPSLLYESSKKFQDLVNSNNQEIQKQHRIWLQYMKKKSNLIEKQTNFKKVNRSFSVDLL